MSTWTYYSGAARAVNNFEKFLTQKEANGATTSTINREHEKNFSLNANLLSSLWNIDSARRGASIGFALDDTFMTGGPNSVIIKVVYVDSGTATFTLNYTGGTRTHTKENSGDVRTVTWVLGDFSADATGDSDDFTLTGDGTTDFMLVRVIKP